MSLSEMSRLLKKAGLSYCRILHRRRLFSTGSELPGTGELSSSSLKHPLILGIESSCDDTAAAIIDENGRVLGEACASQVVTSVKFGGVVPSVAKKLHERNIRLVTSEALESASISPSQLTAVAVTVKPGQTRCIKVGFEHAKHLCLKYNKPLIPIHHMEAHALTARMIHKIDFPFLVLLISGGHSVLAVSHAIDKWSILGETIDEAPGVLLDQLARRMKLRNLPGFDAIAGGRAIEILAKDGDDKKYDMPYPITNYRDANTSFTGLRSYVTRIIEKAEVDEGIEGGRVVSCLNDICASLQYGITRHLMRQIQKGIRFADFAKLMETEDKILVMSGGVASNKYIRNAFEKLCEYEDYKLVVPPPKLCTDNGIMVAWNGIEKWKKGYRGIMSEEEMNSVEIVNKAPLGANLTEDIRRAELARPKYVKF